MLVHETLNLQDKTKHIDDLILYVCLKRLRKCLGISGHIFFTWPFTNAAVKDTVQCMHGMGQASAAAALPPLVRPRWAAWLARSIPS